MEIYKDFTFEAAHQLPNVPDGHKCSRMHGHTYDLRIVVDGPIGTETGWVQDFSELKEAMSPIIQQLDHYCLNDVKGLENPTSEILAIWIWGQVISSLPLLKRIEVKETRNSGCVYFGPEPS